MQETFIAVLRGRRARSRLRCGVWVRRIAVREAVRVARAGRAGDAARTQLTRPGRPGQSPNGRPTWRPWSTCGATRACRPSRAILGPARPSRGWSEERGRRARWPPGPGRSPSRRLARPGGLRQAVGVVSTADRQAGARPGSPRSGGGSVSRGPPGVAATEAVIDVAVRGGLRHRPGTDRRSPNSTLPARRTVALVDVPRRGERLDLTTWGTAPSLPLAFAVHLEEGLCLMQASGRASWAWPPCPRGRGRGSATPRACRGGVACAPWSVGPRRHAPPHRPGGRAWSAVAGGGRNVRRSNATRPGRR